MDGIIAKRSCFLFLLLPKVCGRVYKFLYRNFGSAIFYGLGRSEAFLDITKSMGIALILNPTLLQTSFGLYAAWLGTSMAVVVRCLGPV